MCRVPLIKLFPLILVVCLLGLCAVTAEARPPQISDGSQPQAAAFKGGATGGGYSGGFFRRLL